MSGSQFDMTRRNGHVVCAANAESGTAIPGLLLMLLTCPAPKHTTMAIFTQHLGPDMDLKVSRKQKKAPYQQCVLACEGHVQSQQLRVAARSRAVHCVCRR